MDYYASDHHTLREKRHDLSMINHNMGASGGIMVGKLDYNTSMTEFESYLVPHSLGLVPHLSKKPVCFFVHANQF